MTLTSAATKTGSSSFCMDFNQQDTSIERKKMKDSISGFEWTEVRSRNLVGVEIDNKTVVPCRYSWISFNIGYFLAYVSISNNSVAAACYTPTGTCLIHEKQGYNSIFMHNVKDHDYIEVEKNNKMGAFSLDGKELIPIKMGYENIYHGKYDRNLYRVTKSGMWGVYDVGLKREIIVPQYSEIYIFEEDGQHYIKIYKDKLAGICLANGKEIIPPKYKSAIYTSGQFCYEDADNKFHYTGLDINGNMISSKDNVSSSTTNNVSSSSTSSSSFLATSIISDSPYGKLLFNGIFTATGKGIAGNQITATCEPFLTSFRIYEKKIFCHNDDSSMDYYGEETLFNIRWRKYYNGGNIAYYVSPDGTVLHALTLTFDTLMGKMSSTTYTIYEYGDTRHLHSGNTSAGNGYTPQNSNSGTPTPNIISRDCSYCHGSGRCPNCNGTGWVTNPFAFEHTTTSYPCVNCNKNGDKVNNPNKGKCSLCNGTGKR